MGSVIDVETTFTAKLRLADKVELNSLKRHPRETYGDVVHWLVSAELQRRGRSEPTTESLDSGVTA